MVACCWVVDIIIDNLAFSLFALCFVCCSKYCYIYFLNPTPSDLCFLGPPNFLAVLHTDIVDVGSL